MREVIQKMPEPPSSSTAAAWQADWMASLLDEGYLDDARCAESYTRVHLEHKKWGPLKIKAGLAARGCLAPCPRRPFRPCPSRIGNRRRTSSFVGASMNWEDHQDRVVRWLMQRGFPQRMVWTALDGLSSDAARPNQDS